ncbi:hypothetical protein BC828DRAFT_355293 [Blastocladiella britannica]|nr:hypothetical protein BC828DRAFT_355293 [Blastocladiella britannica]
MTSIASLLALLAFLSATANAHMMMTDPAPRQWKTNPGPGGLIDYSYTAPLGAYPCKGYPAQAPVLTVAAGSSVAVSISGGAQHDGGHCQFALSYDNDKTFVVLETIIRECVRTQNPQYVNVQIPASAPSGKATFAWTWINAIGNREYYMGCSDITVTGGSGPSGSLTGPELLVANLPGQAVEFPEFPGTLPDGREKFAQRKIITVRGSGAAGSPFPSSSSKSSSVSSSTKSSSSGAPVSTKSSTSSVPVSTKSSSASSTTTQAASTQQPPKTRTRGQQQTTALTSTAKPTTTSQAQPTASNTGGDNVALPSVPCKENDLACKGPNALLICNLNSWIQLPVPRGTVCKKVGTAPAFLALA